MYTLTFKLKKVVVVSITLVLLCSICISVSAATWGNYQTSSSSGQAALPSDSQDEIDAGEDEYDTAPISFRILGADRLDATEAAAQSGVLFFSSVYPIASECLDYFLSKSRDTEGIYVFPVDDLINESESSTQYLRMISEIDNLLPAAEVFLGPNSHTYIHEIIQNKSNESASGRNWTWSVGKYRTWSMFSCSRIDTIEGPCYNGTITYHVSDYYNWDPNYDYTVLGVAASALWELHYTGRARNFFIEGDASVRAIWEMSQRSDSGAEIEFIG